MGTHHQGNQKEVRALDAYIKLMRAAETVMADLNHRLMKLNLSATQFGTLETLYHLGSLQSGHLAKKLLKSSGNLTMVLDNLEKRGLIHRERDESDRRAVMIHLTDHGRRLIEEIFPEHAAYIAEQMNCLSESEQEQLGDLCRRLGTAIRDGEHLHRTNSTDSHTLKNEKLEAIRP